MSARGVTSAGPTRPRSCTASTFALLRELNREQGTTVLFVAHNPDLAARCDRTIRVFDGLLDRGPGLP